MRRRRPADGPAGRCRAVRGCAGYPAGVFYLNQAGTSWPKPAPVREAVAAALAADPGTWDASFEAHHRAVAAAFGVPDPGRLLLTPGCTSALALAVADLPWAPGDRVVISGLEHHALHRPVRALERRGVEVVVLPWAPGEPVALDVLEVELARGGVRLVATTAACNVTGELLPVVELAALARAHGALALVDAAQVAGWLPLDVGRMGVDLLAFAGHKALHAPWGIGGLWVAPGVAMDVPEASCALPVDAAAEPCSPMPGYCDGGSVDRAALAGLAAALEWLADPARADRLARARGRIARLTEAVATLPGVRVRGPVDVAAKLPTLALTVADHAPARLAAGLAGRGVVAAAGLQCAPLAHASLGTAPAGVLRLSVGPTNTDEDVDAAAAALRELLRAPRPGAA